MIDITCFAKLPIKLKQYIASGHTPYIPSRSVPYGEIIKSNPAVTVQKIIQPVKTDRNKTQMLDLYNKEIHRPRRNVEIDATIKASKHHITPPIIAKTDNGFLQLDGGKDVFQADLTPKEAFRAGRQAKRLEKRALNNGLRHQDLHPGNILINKKKNKLHFVDWSDSGVRAEMDLYNKNRKTTEYLKKGYDS